MGKRKFWFVGKRKRKRGEFSRREFLYLIFGGTVTVASASTCGAVAWALRPQKHYGIELFAFKPTQIPSPADRVPLLVIEGNFNLSNTQDGVRALCRSCPHLGSYLKWVSTNQRFECPSHGSKYTLEGKYIEGPGARYHLFQFEVEVTSPHGTEHTDGKPISVSVTDATNIVVDVTHTIVNECTTDQG